MAPCGAPSWSGSAATNRRLCGPPWRRSSQGAAVAVAAKYAVDKTSGLRGKAAMAALRHTARSTLGDLVPESLHDKLRDSGFFGHDDEGVQVKDFFNQSEDGEPEEQHFLDEDEDVEEPDEEQPQERDFFEEPDEEPEDQDFFDEPEDDEDDVDEDHEPRDEGGAQRAADVAPANGRAEAPGVMDVLSRTPRRRRRTRRS
jgi:hypothetical protein